MTRLTAALAAAMLILAAAWSPPPAQAQDSAADVRAVIRSQIDAFLADDWSAAYAHAAPSIRQIFTSPESFMAMVRSGYQPVYRPKSVTFGRMRQEGGRVVQEVFVVDHDGEPWTALYSMEMQADGSWKISGCRLAETAAESV